ncbi:MAG: copper chaperone [Caldilineae bacterium]|nr:MAG: copper chaperone [Caldilineae bacterium]
MAQQGSRHWLSTEADGVFHIVSLPGNLLPGPEHHRQPSTQQPPNRQDYMETATFSVPAMYGDHHVKEVRRLLLELPGVEDVYASSAFQVVEVTYEPGKVSPEAIETVLDKAGYLDELPVPKETDKPATEAEREEVFFRHSTAFEQAGPVVTFSQEVPTGGRPLWPCPGLGPIPTMED